MKREPLSLPIQYALYYNNVPDIENPLKKIQENALLYPYYIRKEDKHIRIKSGFDYNP